MKILEVGVGEAERIAKGLSEPQRETILDRRRCVRSYKPAQELIELGLWDGDGDELTIYPSFTALGLAVRDALRSPDA